MLFSLFLIIEKPVASRFGPTLPYTLTWENLVKINQGRNQQQHYGLLCNS